MPLVQPNSAAITANINDTLQSDGSLAEALDTSILWCLNKAAVDPLSASVIATQSTIGRWRAKTIAAAPSPTSVSTADIATLIALPTAGFNPGQTALVQTVWDYWSYDPFDVTSVADGITIVAAFGGGFWHRMMIADQLWIHQVTWFIDPATGDDENTGDTAIAALATHAEYNRRVGGPFRVLETTDPNIFITLVGTVPNVFAFIRSEGPAVTYQGALPAPTVTAVAAVTNADPATQTPFTVTLAAAWAGQKLAHDTTNDTWFWGYDDVATLAQCTPPNQGGGLPFFTLGAEPAIADAIDLYDYLAMPILDSYQFTSVGAYGLVLSLLYLRGASTNQEISGTVITDRCSGSIFIVGEYPLIFTSASIFPGAGPIGWISSFTASGCFFADLVFSNAALSLLSYNNYLTVEFHSCQIQVIDARLISSATLPLAATILVADKSLVADGPLWSDADPGATLTVNNDAFILMPAAPGGTARLNVTNLAFGFTPPMSSPALIPGAVVPALSSCATPAELFAAPFIVGAFAIANDYTDGTHVIVKT